MNSSPLKCFLPVAVASALVLALSSCATHPSANTAPPGSGLAEYLDLVQRSRQAVASTLTSLDTLNAQGPTPSKAVVSAFSEQVDLLQSRSVQVRARAQAMQERGDAYFENWEANMSSIADPRIKASAQQHRPELQRSFAGIKVILEHTRTSFQSFLAGLRQLRTTLEADSASLPTASTQALVQNARKDGQQVEQDLNAVAAELRHMTEMLLSPGGTAQE